MSEELEAGAGTPWPKSGPGVRKVQGRSDRTRTDRLLACLEGVRGDIEEVVLSPAELTATRVATTFEVLLDGLIDLSLLFRSHLAADLDDESKAIGEAQFSCPLDPREAARRILDHFRGEALAEMVRILSDHAPEPGAGR